MLADIYIAKRFLWGELVTNVITILKDLKIFPSLNWRSQNLLHQTLTVSRTTSNQMYHVYEIHRVTIYYLLIEVESNYNDRWKIMRDKISNWPPLTGNQFRQNSALLYQLYIQYIVTECHGSNIVKIDRGGYECCGVSGRDGRGCGLGRRST